MTNHEIKGRSLAYGYMGNNIPFKGKFMDGKSVTEIDGDLQWKTSVPDSRPEEGKMDVFMSLFVDGARIARRPKGCLRLPCDMVSRLNEGDAGAESAVMKMLLESSGNAERFDIRPVA